MNNNFIKSIEAGLYKDCYFVYNRKSTDEPNNQLNSLSYQKTENLRFAKSEKLKIADITIDRFCTDGIITEKHSSFKEDEMMIFNNEGGVQFNVERPKFYKLVEYLNKGLFKGAVFLSWDRASRNPTDSNIIKKLLKNGVDLRFTLAKYDKSSSGKLHADIDAMFSEHHSRVTSEKVSLAITKLRRQSRWTNKAPVGYLNEGTSEWKNFDPVRSPIVKRFFELASEGWSLVDIAKWANEQGFTMPPMRKKRTRAEIEQDEGDEDGLAMREKISHKVLYTTIQPILRNRFYIAEVLNEFGVWVPSSCHEALVSEEIFNMVQIQLNKKNKSKKYNVPLEHPFRYVFNCKDCQRSYTPYPQKGIMYCQSKCKVGCENSLKNFNIKKLLADKVRPLIEKLVFTEDELKVFEERLSTDIGVMEKNRIKLLADKDRQKHKLREDLAYLRENKLSLLRTKTYTPESIIAEEEKLENEIGSLMVEEEISEEAMRDTMQDVWKISELLKDALVYWDYADLYEKQEIVQIIFSELSISKNTLEYKVQKGFIPFETRFVSSCAQERT
jgi:DNA invertase Pin-like site-specific DNA recombinase